MSIQAVAWALEQDLPARPKLVLVSIANHADHRTGYCWLKIETIADEASCSPRGVFNFLGDLVRNGYIRREQRKGEDGKQRANDYWILFERPPTEWNAERPKPDPEVDDAEIADAQDVVGPDAPDACGGTEAPAASEPVDNPPGAVGPHAPGCSPIDSAEPSKINPSKDPRESRFAAPPRRYQPPPQPVERPQGAVERDREAKRIFVFEGTRAWDAWMAVKRQGGRTFDLVTTAEIDGKSRRGWWFPSLFPPSDKPATGPPNKAA